MAPTAAHFDAHFTQKFAPAPAKDALIVARRRAEMRRERMLAQVDYYNRSRLVSDFDETFLSRQRANAVRRRYGELQCEASGTIENRKNRLQNLYKEDHERWSNELTKLRARPASGAGLSELRRKVEIMRERERKAQEEEAKEKTKLVVLSGSHDVLEMKQKLLKQQISADRETQMQQAYKRQAEADAEKRKLDALSRRLQELEIAEKECESRTARARQRQLACDLKDQMAEAARLREAWARMDEEQEELARRSCELAAARDALNEKRKEHELRKLNEERTKTCMRAREQRERAAATARATELKWLAELEVADRAHATAAMQHRLVWETDLAAFMEHVKRGEALAKQREKEIEAAHAVDSAILREQEKKRDLEAQIARQKLYDEVLRIRAGQLEERIAYTKARMQEMANEQKNLDAVLAEVDALAETEKLSKKTQIQAYQEQLRQQIKEREKRIEQTKRAERDLEERLDKDRKKHNEWIQKELESLTAQIEVHKNAQKGASRLPRPHVGNIF